MSHIQLDIFDRPTLNIAKAYKIAMNDDIRESNLSRAQVLDRMNDLAERHGVCLVHGNGKLLTIGTLDKWLNPADLSRQMPAKAIPLFCAATGRHKTMDAVAVSLGLRVIGQREQKMLRWADAKITVKEQQKMIRKIEGEL